MSDELDELVTVEAAARAIGMHRDRVKAIAITNGLAIRWGGSDRHPRLKVNLPKLKQVILRQVYVPKGPGPLPVAARHHRLVRC